MKHLKRKTLAVVVAAVLVEEVAVNHRRVKWAIRRYVNAVNAEVCRRTDHRWNIFTDGNKCRVCTRCGEVEYDYLLVGREAEVGDALMQALVRALLDPENRPGI